MKPEKALEMVNNIISLLSPEEKEKVIKMIDYNAPIKSPFTLYQAVANLHIELSEDIRKETAKSSGCAKALQAAKRILKSAPDYKECLQFAYIKDNKQYFTDGYRAAVLADFLPLPELPQNMEYMPLTAFDKMLDNNNTKILPTPDINKLQAYIKIEKARGNKQPLYCFGEDTTVCNASYLLDMLYIIPNAEIHYTGRYNPIILKNNTDNYAILMPVKSDIISITKLD